MFNQFLILNAPLFNNFMLNLINYKNIKIVYPNLT